MIIEIFFKGICNIFRKNDNIFCNNDNINFRNCDNNGKNNYKNIQIIIIIMIMKILINQL